MFRPQLTTIGITLKWFCHSLWDFTLTSPTPKKAPLKKKQTGKKNNKILPASLISTQPSPPFFGSNLAKL